jgi:hypothetical protein
MSITISLCLCLLLLCQMLLNSVVPPQNILFMTIRLVASILCLMAPHFRIFIIIVIADLY